MLTQRLGSATQKDNAFIDALLEKIKENPTSCDEVWIASEYGFPKMETHLESIQVLSAVAKKFRHAGVRVSLQISNTIGHGQYMSAKDCSGLVYENSPVEKMVGADGTVADYCFCWNGENFRNYVYEEVRQYAAEIKPYCVWIDDDFRASNHAPVSFGCFCADCMARFNALHNTHYTREELVQEINFGDVSVREKYIAFIRAGLGDLMYQIAKIIHEVSPDSSMGFQYCAHGAYTGYAYDYIFDAMRRGTGKNPKSRPGGGAYDDHNPNVFIDKAVFMNWQNAMLPEYVTEIRPEIENLPDVVFGKTIAGTCFETSLYFACGATAMSYAMLMNDYEPMEWHGKMLASFAKHKPYWKKLAEANENTTPAGLQVCMSKTFYRYKTPESSGMFAWNTEPWYACREIITTAIPLAFGKAKEPCYLLNATVAERLSEEEVEQLLTVPVVCDASALYVLQKRGYGDSFGTLAYPINASQLHEEYTMHPINHDFTCGKWKQSFSYTTGYFLKDTNNTTEILGIYNSENIYAPPNDDGGIYPYGIANAIVTTARGAKWAVFGHTMWNPIISADKRNQILRAADYISNNRLPALLKTPQQAMLLPRENAEMKTTSVSIVNTTIGISEPLEVIIRRPAGKKFLYQSATQNEIELPYTKIGTEYRVVTPESNPWSVATIFITE